MSARSGTAGLLAELIGKRNATELEAINASNDLEAFMVAMAYLRARDGNCEGQTVINKQELPARAFYWLKEINKQV